MALGPKGRGLRYSGQPTNLNVRKPAQVNVNMRRNDDVHTTGKNLPGTSKGDKAVKKIGTPFNLPDVQRPNL